MFNEKRVYLLCLTCFPKELHVKPTLYFCSMIMCVIALIKHISHLLRFHSEFLITNVLIDHSRWGEVLLIKARNLKP